MELDPWLAAIRWTESPKPEHAPTLQLTGVAATLHDIQQLVDTEQPDALDPSWVRRLRFAIRRINALVQRRSHKPFASRLPGRRRPGRLDQPLDL